MSSTREFFSDNKLVLPGEVKAKWHSLNRVIKCQIWANLMAPNRVWSHRNMNLWPGMNSSVTPPSMESGSSLRRLTESEGTMVSQQQGFVVKLHSKVLVLGGKCFVFVFRILWVVAVLVAVTLFLYQVGMRTHEYSQYNTNINVEVKFVPELKFPSVTLCNQKTFRSAVATL